VPEAHHTILGRRAGSLKEAAKAQRLYLRTESAGTRRNFSNPDLGKTLRLIAHKGADTFYKGENRAGIVKTSTALGGKLCRPMTSPNFPPNGLSRLHRLPGLGSFTSFLPTAGNGARWKWLKTSWRYRTPINPARKVLSKLHKRLKP